MTIDFRAAIQSARRQHASGAGGVLDILLRSVAVEPDELERQLAVHGVRVVRAESDAAPDFSVIDRETAAALRCVPLRVPEQPGIALALADPWRDDVLRRVSAMLGFVPPPVAVPATLLARWLQLDDASQPLAGASDAGPATRAASDVGQTGGGPVVDFVDAAIRAAFSTGASDVHFECGRAGLVVKLRRDGVLTPFAAMDDPTRAEEVISRIKVLAHLDITERRTPQDGRFRFDTGDGGVDLRVSVMPSVFGEDAVLRLLDKAQLRTRDDAATLDRLGFAPESAERIRDLASQPHGLLLVTGPTGSGKTTTVYAVLSEVNSGLEKIITIEDPVEYELPGVLQIPVNERKGLTFAKGLRSILRHDPDRILVGEIRDAETAEIAVQSALTGHQVFTTVHANSLFDVMGRFRHFGLDAFGFMASLNGVVVQRLVRCLCSACAAERPASDKDRIWLESCLQATLSSLPRAVGCPECRGTGYRGRIVLAEVHAIDDAFRDMVIAGEPVSALRAHVTRSGVELLGVQAARMVLRGGTTPEEIKRAVGWQQ